MATAMVKAADALWDAWGSHDHTVAAASTQQSRSSAPSSGKRGDKRSGNAHPKSHTPFPSRFSFIPKPQRWHAQISHFTNILPIGLTGAFRPVLDRKTNLPPNHFQFGGLPHTCECHGYAFPCKRWLNFLTDELTNDRYLVDTGATLSIVPCNQNSSPSGPLLKGADGQPIPSWGFIK